MENEANNGSQIGQMEKVIELVRLIFAQPVYDSRIQNSDGSNHYVYSDLQFEIVWDDPRILIQDRYNEGDQLLRDEAGKMVITPSNFPELINLLERINLLIQRWEPRTE